MSSDDTITEPVITAACGQCGDAWQRAGRGEHDVQQVQDLARDHEEATGHAVTCDVEYERTQGGAFWDDLRQSMASPEFAAEYGRASAEIAAADEAANQAHLEHIEQSGAKSPPAAGGTHEPWDKWPPWLKRDGTSGVPHCRPDGSECPYLAYVICARCGWADPDPERVARVREVLEAARATAEAARAQQRKNWKQALAGHNAAKRRGRVKRPGKPITGYVVQPPPKRGEQQ